MNNLVVGVMAGTPVDTQMGVDYLVRQGLQVKAYPVSCSSREQAKFQLGPSEEKERVISKILREIKKEGISALVVYCNSLSGAVDMPSLSRQEDIKILTPLDVYRILGTEYKRLGVIAANSQGLAGIEKTCSAVNPDLDILGAALLPLVNGIESRKQPSALMAEFALASLCRFFELNNVEAILLGCTHFPYLKEELEKVTQIPVLDPADRMLQLLLADLLP